MKLDSRTFQNARQQAHLDNLKAARLEGRHTRKVRQALDDAGFDLGDVFQVLRPAIEGAARPVIQSTGFFSSILGAVFGEVLDAVGEAL